MRMVERSTRIKICAGDSTADKDCAISAAGSFPILMLQKGRATTKTEGATSLVYQQLGQVVARRGRRPKFGQG